MRMCRCIFDSIGKKIVYDTYEILFIYEDDAGIEIICKGDIFIVDECCKIVYTLYYEFIQSYIFWFFDLLVIEFKETEIFKDLCDSCG